MGNSTSKKERVRKTSSSSIDEDRKRTKLGEEAEVEFETKLAEGSTATTYKGYWNGLDVAIKQFREDGEQTEFLRELLILGKLKHPNIISYLTSNATKRFIVMEFILGGTLKHVMKSESILGWPDKISVAYDIVKGMTYLHANGVVHCDLRCANCLVTSFSPYHVKIFDFSSSKMLVDVDINEGTWSGDAHFQPPEVCRRRLDKFSKVDYPPKADVFSLLWEMITRHEPFYELEEISLVCRQIIEGNRPKIPEDTPNQYSDVIKKCWDQDPIKRPAFEELVGLFQQLDIHGPQLEIRSIDV